MSGIGASGPFSQVLVGAVGGYRTGGAWQGTAVADAFGGGIGGGWAGAAYGAGIAGLAQAGGSLTTLSEVAGGSLGYSIAPGVSVGFSLPAAMAHRQEQRKRAAIEQAKRREAARQRAAVKGGMFSIPGDESGDAGVTTAGYQTDGAKSGIVPAGGTPTNVHAPEKVQIGESGPKKLTWEAYQAELAASETFQAGGEHYNAESELPRTVERHKLVSIDGEVFTVQVNLPSLKRGKWVEGDGTFRYYKKDPRTGQAINPVLGGKTVKFENGFTVAGGFPEEAYFAPRGEDADFSRVQIDRVDGTKNDA